jgi:glycogen synthase
MDEDGLDYALNRAIDAFYNDKQWFRGLQSRVMKQDWSWNRCVCACVCVRACVFSCCWQLGVCWVCRG